MGMKTSGLVSLQCMQREGELDLLVSVTLNGPGEEGEGGFCVILWNER